MRTFMRTNSVASKILGNITFVLGPTVLWSPVRVGFQLLQDGRPNGKWNWIWG